MKTKIIAIATVAALAAGIGSASAADNQAMSNSSTANKSMSSTMQPMAQDNLTLTPAQQRMAWRDIGRQAKDQTAPNFTASVGATLPSDVSLRAIPAKVADRVSALKPYDYALIHDRLLIVNPSDKKIVDVISRHA
jgi:hypothetical protein